MQTIKDQLQKTIDTMEGPWIVRKNSYEKEFCKHLNWLCKEGRYADAMSGDTLIELKKGQSCMWFDMVRYAEIFKGIGPQNTVTLFIRYDKRYIHVRDIYVIDTKKILEFMKMDDHIASFCIKTKAHLPRGLNMQACATHRDMRNMASYIVTSRKERERGMMLAEDKRIKRKRCRCA